MHSRRTRGIPALRCIGLIITMNGKFTAYCKKNALQLSILLVGILILVALILNLIQGGFWIIAGMNGKSSYEVAVENGFVGTRDEWLRSLKGSNGVDGIDGVDGANGKSAYEIACENGFEGSEQEWLLSMQFGKAGSDGKDGADGLPGKNGKDGVGIKSVKIDENGDLIVTLTNGETCNAGSIRDLVNE